MGKKKDKVVDLKPKKVTEEQLERVRKIVGAINKLYVDVGAVELQKHRMLNVLVEGAGEMEKVQAEFKAQYGTPNIDIQTGELKFDEDDKSSNS